MHKRQTLTLTISAFLLMAVLISGISYWKPTHVRAQSKPTRQQMQIAFRHKRAVEAKSYVIVLHEKTGHGDQDSKALTITVAKNFEGSTAEVKTYSNLTTRFHPAPLTFSSARLELWKYGQVVFYSGDTKTKQTFSYPVHVGFWVLKAERRPDASAGCLADYLGDPTDPRFIAAGKEDIMGYSTVKFVQDTPLGYLSVWRLPEADCEVVQQQLTFKDGGTDTKTFVSISLNTEPDPSIFDVSNFTEASPREDEDKRVLLWYGHTATQNRKASTIEKAYAKNVAEAGRRAALEKSDR